jgi:uncharacterized SAM-binding protein YcdF (DUF218 family)
MFVFLSKLLPLFAYPLGLCCALLIVALLFNKRRRLRNGLVIAAVAILWLFSNRWVDLALTRSLEWQYLPAQGVGVPTAEAIVVLGGGTYPAQYPRPTTEMSGAGDRVFYAAHLYRDGHAPLVLLSGGTIEWMGDTASTPATEMEDIITFMGVPQSALLLENKSQNTHEDAVLSAQMLKAKGIHRILLVTSAIHMPRAMAVFKKQGLEVIPAPTDFKVTQDVWDNLLHGSAESYIINFLPDASDLGSITNDLKEYIGLFVYRLMGWA